MTRKSTLAASTAAAYDQPAAYEKCQKQITGEYFDLRGRCNQTPDAESHRDPFGNPDHHHFVRPICTCLIGTSAGRECCPRHHRSEDAK